MKHHNLSTRTGSQLCTAMVAVFRAIRIMACGAQKCAAHSLHRLTHERPACERPTRGRRSVGVATAARFARYVTGSAQAVRLHPSWHLACTAQKLRSGGAVDHTGHPAVAMASGG